MSAKALAKIQIPAHEPLLQTKIANSLSGICSLINIRKAQLLKLDQLASSRFIEMFGDPVTNPKGWQQEQLDSHIDVLTGFPFDSSKYVDSGIKICGGLIIMPDRIAWENCKYWENYWCVTRRHRVRKAALTDMPDRSRRPSVC